MIAESWLHDRLRASSTSNGDHATCPIEVHDDVIKWRHFPRHWNFVWGIHQWPMLSLLYALTNHWVNNRDAGGLRRHRAHYDVTVLHWTHFGSHWTHFGLGTPYGDIDLGQDWLRLSDGSKLLPGLMLTYHQRCSVIFTQEHSHKNGSLTLSVACVRRIRITTSQWVNVVRVLSSLSMGFTTIHVSRTFGQRYDMKILLRVSSKSFSM